MISGKNYRKNSQNSRKFGYSLITVNFTVVFPEKFYPCSFPRQLEKRHSRGTSELIATSARGGGISRVIVVVAADSETLSRCVCVCSVLVREKSVVNIHTYARRVCVKERGEKVSTSVCSRAELTARARVEKLGVEELSLSLSLTLSLLLHVHIDIHVTNAVLFTRDKIYSSLFKRRCNAHSTASV